MKNLLRLLLLLSLVTPCVTQAQFVPNDEVELLRDEPLLFNTSVYRQGRKGERFRVAAYRADSRKIFLFATDAKGKTFALNVPDAAVGPVAKDVGMLNEHAFAALRAGRLDEAQKLLLQIAMLDRERSVCAEIATHLGRVSAAMQGYQLGMKQQAQTQVEVQRRLKNAAVVDQPNSLFPNDNSNQVRAEQMRKDAEQLAENAKAAIESKQEQVASELKLLGELAVKRETAGAYGEALDISEMVTAFASQQFKSARRLDSFGSSGHSGLQEKAAKAQKHLEDARRNMSAKKLNAALQSAGAGLAAEPGSYSLRRLQGELSQRLEVSGKSYATAVAHQQLKHYDEALKAMEQARGECMDHEASENLAITLKKTIAEKEERTAKAKTAEAAGSFAAALEIYDTYAMDSDTKRIIPQYAKQREAEGDFLLAYNLYEKAGLAAEMQRVQKMKEEQLAEYGKARILLIDGKFTDALTIFRRYKDGAAEKNALRQQGGYYESKGKFDEAIEVYRLAHLAEEVARVREFVSTRDSLIADGKRQEQAANYDKAIESFQKANATDEVQRVASTVAKECEQKKDYESAANYFEVAGLFNEAGRIRKTYDLSNVASLRILSGEEIFKRCVPACVTIVSASDEGVGLGSGFFIAKGGYILTNNHVIEGATRVRIITSVKNVLDAEVIRTMHVPDLALLKVKADSNPALRLGDSDKVGAGAYAATIGSPKGNLLKFTHGDISGTEIYRKNNCFQISVLINHGNSGGPLLDQMGQVIGITTFGEGTAAVLNNGKSIGTDIQGINYAIKINEAKKFLKDNIPGF